MSEEPVASQNGPYVIEEEPGTKFWCSCGVSAKQPYCDGTHKAGSPFKPIMVEITEKKTVAWCGCRRSGNKPYCDGTHAK